ncbi:MAG: DUF4404 family protein, partial [Burkholderiaceae bacterium]
MSNDKIRALLSTLRGELEKTELDDATREQIRQLDADIHALLASDRSDQPPAQEGEDHPVIEQAKALEIRFAAKHPVAE